MRLFAVLAVCCVAIAQAYPGQPGYLPTKKVVTPIVTEKGLNCKTRGFGGTIRGIDGLERMSGPRGFGWIWGSDDIFDDDHDRHDEFDLDDGYFGFLGNSGMGRLGHAMSKGGYGHAMSKGGYGDVMSNGGYGHAVGKGGYGHAIGKGGYGHAMGNGGYASYRGIDDIDDMSYKTIDTPVIQTGLGFEGFEKKLDDRLGMVIMNDDMHSSKTIFPQNQQYEQSHQMYPKVQDYQQIEKYPQPQQYPQTQQFPQVQKYPQI